MSVADLDGVREVGFRWSLNYFIFMGNSEKMLAKWSNRTPSAKLKPLFKIPGTTLCVFIHIKVTTLRPSTLPPDMYASDQSVVTRRLILITVAS